ncbi:hypothetical protein D3C71_153490 [compost metagenome]
MNGRTRHDDFSCDPRLWSYDKLRLEKRNGMPAVMAEWERRMEERDREREAETRRSDTTH